MSFNITSSGRKFKDIKLNEYKTAIQKASSDLKRNNIITPVLDSEILMSHTLKKDRKFYF